MTRLALEKNRITAAALAIIVVGGLWAFDSLPRNEDPGFIIRTALVITHFPGASPERVENLVTDTIEEAVQEIPELDFVNSESRTGTSLVYVNIQERYKNMRPIWDSLRRKVDRIRDDLPDGVVGPFVNDEFGDVFGILLTLTGEGFSYAELKDRADQVREELLGLENAAKVEIYGAQDERIFVEYNNARLAELDLSVSQLQRILESRNIITPGGNVLMGPERVVLEPSGNFESWRDVERTVIRLPGRSEVLYLGDVATVRRGYVDPPAGRVLSSGQPCLVLGISLREGGDILELGERVGEKIREIQARLPIGLEMTVMADQPARVATKVREFVSNLLQAVALVLVVMLFSLGLRTGTVVAALIPTAMLMSLMVMRFVGIGLDQMSLAALIIALGMLIDNAIVMSESIMVQMEAGRSAFDAAVDSGRELRVPLLISSLTTAAAFLPIYLAKSVAGEYTGVLFEVVTITLLCSWLLALTMTPLLCVTFLRVGARSGQDTFGSRFYRGYRFFLTLCLRNRAATAGIAVLLFVGAMRLFPFVPVLFFPKADRSFFMAQLELPTGTAIERTLEVAHRVDRFVADELLAGAPGEEGVTHWVSFAGGGEPRFILTFNVEQTKPNYIFMLLNTTSYPAVAGLMGRIQGFCDRELPDVTATIQPSNMGPPVEKPIQVRLSGRDPDRLASMAGKVRERLAALPGTRNVGDDWGARTKKIVVEVNQPRARRAGLSSLDVAVSLQSILSGIQSTEYREQDEIIPVTLRSADAEREGMEKLESFDVYSQTTGRSVPLKQVADLRVEWEPSKIFRRDRVKTITVESDLAPGITASEVNEALIPWLEEEAAGWDLGYGYELGGEVESSVKANASIVEQVPVAGLIILLLLVGQFNSFRRPLIIVATIPLGLIGVILGLLAFRSYFGFMTFLGIISLSGIVINNAIVLLDRIRIEIEENGLDPRDAIVESAQRRLRPILLTTLTTIGGLLPLYLGGGPMWEPMAVAIMCGLAFATVLTLGLVPVLYALFFRVSFKGYRYAPAGAAGGD